jgi:hypothetical protein
VNRPGINRDFDVAAKARNTRAVENCFESTLYSALFNQRGSKKFDRPKVMKRKALDTFDLEVGGLESFGDSTMQHESIPITDAVTFQKFFQRLL